MIENPWTSRFENFEDSARLRALVENIPEPLVNLRNVPPVTAMERMKARLSELFIVTPKIESVLRAIGNHSAAGSDIRYGDPTKILENTYNEKFEVPLISPMCLCGPAGIGKTKLLRAAPKLLPAGPDVVLNAQHDPVPVRGFVTTTVLQGDRDTLLLYRIAEHLEVPAMHTKDFDRFRKQVRKMAYRDGVGGLHLDEFQHGTLSSANSRITSLLLTARETGMPLTYACNYSLMHRLLKRPQEDRDRILANIVMLTPDTPDSAAWARVVAGTMTVLADSARLDADECCKELGELSGCLPRNLHRLFGVAYAIARESGAAAATMSHVRSAYHSRAYALARDDITALRAIADGRSYKIGKRSDLVCPEELIPDAVPAPDTSTGDAALPAMARQLLGQSMTAQERAGLSIAQASGRKRSKVVPIREQKKRTAQGLADAHDNYQAD